MLVFDDIHWGEPTFLDLIEHIALLSSGASILLLCMARPELSERRPTWVLTLRLEPLEDEDVDELIPKRFPVMLRREFHQLDDAVLWRYFDLLSFRSNAELGELRSAVAAGRNPMAAKVELAKEITARFHGPAAADRVLPNTCFHRGMRRERR